jgi:hypothetical protein
LAVRVAIERAGQVMRAQPVKGEEPATFRAFANSGLGSGALTTVRQPDKVLDADFRHLLHVIAAVATAVWRARAKLEGQPGVELPREFRHLPRHVQAAWDALVAGGIEVQDPKGQRYVPGMAVNPLTFQPVEGLGSEVISETIKPTVFYKDVLIQRADVIVGQPIDDKGGSIATGLAGDNTTVVNERTNVTTPDGSIPGIPGQQKTNPTD